MEEELEKLNLPKDFKLVITGGGRVSGKGAMEVIRKNQYQKSIPENFLAKDFNFPVYTQLDVEDYFSRDDNKSLSINLIFLTTLNWSCLHFHELCPKSRFICRMSLLG